MPLRLQAACPTDAITDGVSVQVTEAAIDLVKPQAIAMLPTELAIPETPYVTSDCGDGTNGQVTALGAVLTVSIDDGDITFSSGIAHLTGALSLGLTGALDFQFCGFTPTTCDAAFSANSVAFSADVAIAVDQCVPSVALTNVQVQLDPYDINVSLAGCGLLSTAADLIYAAYEQVVLDVVSTQLLSSLETELPAMLDSVSTSFSAVELEALGIHVTVAPSSISIVPGALRATLAVGLDPVGGPGACLPSGTLPPPAPTTPTEVTFGLAAPLSVAATHDLAQRAIDVAWYTGLLCFDSADLDLDLSPYLGDIAPGVEVRALVTPATPPKVTFADGGSSQRVKVDLTDVEVAIDVGLPNSTPSRSTAMLDASLTGEVLPDLSSGTLQINFVDASIERFDVVTAGGELDFTEAQLRAIVDTLLLPALRDDLSPIVLGASFIVDGGLAVRLQEVAMQPSYLRADIDLWSIDAADTTAPETVLSGDAPTLTSGRVELRFASVDDQTPPGFMRHQVTLDGVAEDAPRSGQLIALTGLVDGHHELQIAAVDLTGNVDATPVSFSFVSDATPPGITFTEAPYGFLDGNSAHIAFVAYDNHATETQLSYRYEVSLVAEERGGSDELIQHSDLGHRQSLDLRGLPEDRVVRVVIYALDSAGNEGRTETSFAVNQNATLGCQATGHASLAPLAALLVLLPMRRRRHRASRSH